MYKENEEMFFYKISRFQWSKLHSLDINDIIAANTELNDLRLIAECSPECKRIFDDCIAASASGVPIHLYFEKLVHCAENC